jgi:polyphosphate kinase
VSSLVDHPDGSPPRLLNRELSWLDFNERVLALVADARTPLLERLKFCAIFSSNLDEFFQVRVAALKDQVAAGITQLSPDGRPPGQQLLEIGDRVEDLVRQQEDLLLGELIPAIREHGIVLCRWSELDLDDRKHLDEVFDERVFPVLTPLGVDPAHPFPYISNLSLNLAVSVYDDLNGAERFARVKVPPTLPRFIGLPDGERFILLEDLIAAHLDALFPGMTVVDHWMFRVTRNADLTVEEEEADDLLAALEMELRRRRFGRAVRLEIEAGASDRVLELLVSELDLTEDDISFHRAPLDLTGLWALHRLDRPELKDEPWVPVPATRFSAGPAVTFSEIAKSDILVHHPYDSFASSFEAFVRNAAGDPDVIGLKATVYRTSDETPLVPALIEASEDGKQSVCLVELKARFDERRNIEWSQTLERAGVHVVYGFPNLKIHAKATLVVRREPGGLRRYVHIGTGNYHSVTARVYEDFGLFTADPEIAEDVANLFNYVTGFGKPEAFRKLLVAPFNLRDRLVDEIRKVAQAAAAGKHAVIRLKVNNLSDKAIIDELYLASQAGAKIDLIVRSVCTVRPGVQGMSENIRVRSVLGRFLEHSRVFHFEARSERAYYIGSADLLPRNLDHRLEAVVPVPDVRLQQRLGAALDVLLEDETAWELQSDGTWKRRAPKKNDQPRSAQVVLMRSARRRRRPRA